MNVDFVGAEILGPSGVEPRDLSLSCALIVDALVGRKADLNGYIVLPSIVDFHGAGFERHLAHRRAELMLAEISVLDLAAI